MLVETQQQKSPENLVLVNDVHGVENLSRALLALRLYKAGFVRTGVWFYARPECFSIAIGGIASGGGATWQPGLAYGLTAAEGGAVNGIYELLGRLVARDESQLRSIQIALNAFSSLYTREHYRADDRLVNAITALEALLRIDFELAFRSAFRVAGILASSDDERMDIFDRMRSYYDTRSKIVHGSQLREKHQSDLQNQEPLLQWTRLLLLGFLQLADRGLLDDAFYDDVLISEEGRDDDGGLSSQDGAVFLYKSPFSSPVTSANYTLLPITNASGRFGRSVSVGKIDSDVASTSTVPPPAGSESVSPIRAPLTVNCSVGPPLRNVRPARTAAHQFS